ncbi:MAG: radical SAM protein [Candidatus Paceibacterota bacterium]
MAILGTKEWAEHNRNCFKGCRYNCKYCYARKDAKRWGRIIKDDDWPTMVFNDRCMMQTGKVDGRIMFPTTHDIQPEHADKWFPFLQAMLANGNHVLIVSKPNLASIRMICDKLINYRNQIEFRFTIGTDDELTRMYWEPEAPSVGERIRCLQLAHEAGFRTSVSMEPLLTDNPAVLIERISPYVTGTIWIGMMNHMSIKDFQNGREVVWFHEMKRINSYVTMKKIHDQFKNDKRICWKDSIRDLLDLGSLFAGPR